MRTRTLTPSGQAWVSRARCAASTARTAAPTSVKTRCWASPSEPKARPPSASAAERMMRSCVSSSASYERPSDCSRRVEPSMSLNTKVSVPTGSPAPRSGCAGRSIRVMVAMAGRRASTAFRVDLVAQSQATRRSGSPQRRESLALGVVSVPPVPEAERGSSGRTRYRALRLRQHLAPVHEVEAEAEDAPHPSEARDAIWRPHPGRT